MKIHRGFIDQRNRKRLILTWNLKSSCSFFEASEIWEMLFIGGMADIKIYQRWKDSKNSGHIHGSKDDFAFSRHG